MAIISPRTIQVPFENQWYLNGISMVFECYFVCMLRVLAHIHGDISLLLRDHHCYRYEDKETGITYNSQVAFQVLITPDSYKVGKETVGAEHEIDPEFSNQELEWSTNQRGSTILYGLLVKLEKVDK